MATAVKDTTKGSKKPGIPRPSAIRQSLGHISKGSVTKAFNDVLGKENSSDSSRKSFNVSNKTVMKGKESPVQDKAPTKSPLGAAKPAPAKADRQSPTITSSPSSARKVHNHSASVPAVQTLKPRESGTSLPKYRPKGSLLPSKQVTITRKRKNSLIEALEEDVANESAPEPSKRANRPITPLPRRSRVESTVSDSSKIFNPKVTLQQPQLKTPVKQRPAGSSSMSTPSSVRVRTISSTTNSSRPSVQSKSTADLSTRRNDKRPRLSSESRLSRSKPLTASTSTMTADMSSDSIDIAEVSALLSVSPNLSPVKPIAPSSVRRIAVRRPIKPPIGQTTPSRKAGVSTLPSRQNASTYLSPGGKVQGRQPPSRPGGLPGRKSILSWADFADSKLSEDSVNIAEIAPLQGIATPGSEGYQARERVDSGWGLPVHPSRAFSGTSTGPSIGQVMFPTTESEDVKPADPQPPDGDAVVAKLLRVKLSNAEEEISDLRAKMHAMEQRLNGSTEHASTVIDLGTPLPVDSDVINELSLQRLQNAELEAKTAFLEECLANSQETAALKTAELEQSVQTIQRLEEECLEEKRQSKMAVQAMMDELPARVDRKVEEVVTERVAVSVNTVESKWTAKLNHILAVEDGINRWRDVKSMATNDLDLVKQSLDTLRVLAAGVESAKSIIE